MGLKGSHQSGGGLELQAGFIYGPAVLANVPIKAIGTLNTGELVYMIENDNYTKMVSASGVTKYYTGLISAFRPDKWESYGSSGNGYILASALMTGAYVGPSGNAFIPVAGTRLLLNGDIVYMIHESPYTKMVTSKGEARYYTGPITQFNASSWNTYTSVGDGYKLYKSPVVPLNLQNTRLVQGYLYGPSINGGTNGISISAVRSFPDGNSIYLIYDGSVTKMLSSTGSAKYYNGQISDFKQENWSKYNDAGTGASAGYMIYPSSLLYPLNSLITNSLVCYLDARRPDSLINGSKLWKDLSGLANHFTFQNPLVSDDSSADINTGGIGTGPSSSVLRLGAEHNNGSYSLVIVAKQKVFNSHFAFYIESKQGGRGISCHICWIDGNVYFDNMTCCTRYRNRNYYNMPDKGFKEHMYILTRTSEGGLDIYVDGKLVAQGASGTAQMPDLVGNAYINQTNSWNATMKLMLIYNRGLSEDEVSSVYGWYNNTCKTYKEAQYDSWQSVTDKTLKTLGALKLNRGLLLALDASDRACYNGDSQVNDLSGRGQVFTFVNGPVKIKNGAWKIDGNNILKGPPSSRLGLDGKGDYTVVYRCRIAKISANILFLLSGDVGCENRALGIFPNWSNTMYFDQAGCSGDGQRLLATGAGVGKMATYTFIKNSAGRAIYINGILVEKTTNRGDDITTNSTPMMFFSGSGGTFFGELSHFYVYDYALSDNQIKDMVQYCDNPYLIKNSSWAQAQLDCSRTGAILADIDNICYNGKALSSTSYQNALVPTGSQPGMWINITTCKTEKKKSDDVIQNAHIKCQSVKRPKKYFSALYSKGNTVVFFKGDQALEYDVTTHTSKKPVSISKMFPGIHKDLSSDIDACYVGTTGVVLFKGGLYGTVDAPVPLPLKTAFDLPEGFKSPDAVDYNEKTGVVSFYKDDTIYSCKNLQSTISKINLPNKIFASGIDGIITVNGLQYIFREKYVYTVNTQELNIITDFWTGLQYPFISIKQRCSIITKILPLVMKKIEETRGTNSAAPYEEQMKELKKESTRLCKYQTVHDFNFVKNSQRDKLLALDKSLMKYKNTSDNSLKMEERLVSTNITKNALAKNLELEKLKKCQTDASCTSTDVTRNTCSKSVINAILKQHGYLNKIPKVAEYNIKDHKDIWKYSKITDVQPCPTPYNQYKSGSGSGSGAGAGSDSGAGAGASRAEKEAFSILQDSILQYYINQIPKGTIGRSDVRKAETIDQLSSATKNMVLNLQVDDNVTTNLKLLNDIQTILKKTKNNPNYKKITEDIAQLQRLLEEDTAQLKIINNNNRQELADRLNLTKQTLNIKAQDLHKILALY